MKNQGIFLEYPICGNQWANLQGSKNMSSRQRCTSTVCATLRILKLVRNKNGTKPAFSARDQMFGPDPGSVWTFKRIGHLMCQSLISSHVWSSTSLWDFPIPRSFWISCLWHRSTASLETFAFLKNKTIFNISSIWKTETNNNDIGEDYFCICVCVFVHLTCLVYHSNIIRICRYI